MTKAPVLWRLCFFTFVLLGSLSCRQQSNPEFQIKLSQDANTPQIAVAKLSHLVPIQLLELQIEGGHNSDLSKIPAAMNIELPIRGFLPGRKHKVKFRYQIQGAERETEALEVETPPLPKDFPNIQVNTWSGKPAEPGFTLVSLVPHEAGSPIEQKGMLLVIDSSGQTVWYHKLENSPTEVLFNESGNFVFQTLKGLNFLELDWTGKSLGTWQSTGLRDLKPDDIPVDIDTLHHDFAILEDGSQWSLGSSKREKYIDEILVHFAPDGSILKKLSLYDLLQPDRALYPLFPNFWEFFYGSGVIDWGHSNSIHLNETKDRALVSLRHQSAVVCIRLDSGSVDWILASPEGWNDQFRELLLRKKDDHSWFAKQHAAKWTDEGLILFDNGTTQSRAVEYSIDEEKGEVRQVWEFRDEEAFFSDLFGDVDILEKTNNVLITDGARRHKDQSRWARLVEVTRSVPSQKVWEAKFSRPGTRGCTIYRAERFRSLY